MTALALTLLVAALLCALVAGFVFGFAQRGQPLFGPGRSLRPW
jgi:hypothetical protein